jgi:hypothetical protein
MGKSVLVVLLFAGLLGGGQTESQTDDQHDARELVARAIRAAGGEHTLARYAARTWREKAVYHGAGGDEQYEASYSAEWPDKIKVQIGDFVLVLNGDKGWVKSEGDTREMTRKEMEEHSEGIYSLWVFSLVPLLREDFRLSLLGETKVGGRPTDGIKVSRQGHLDVKMHFDRATGLLAMSETRFREARSGKEIDQETIFSGYHDVSGIKTPTQLSIWRDGKRAVESSIDLRYLEKLDERVFAKP